MKKQDIKYKETIEKMSMPISNKISQDALLAKATHEITDLEIEEVSLVSAPAVKFRFLLMKSDDNAVEPVQKSAEDIYDQGFEDGYEEGYDDGFEDGSEGKMMNKRSKVSKKGIEMEVNEKISKAETEVATTEVKVETVKPVEVQPAEASTQTVQPNETAVDAAKPAAKVPVLDAEPTQEEIDEYIKNRVNEFSLYLQEKLQSK